MSEFKLDEVMDRRVIPAEGSFVLTVDKSGKLDPHILVLFSDFLCRLSRSEEHFAEIPFVGDFRQMENTRTIDMTVGQLELRRRNLTVGINHLGGIIEIVTSPDVLSVMQAIEKQHEIPIHLHRLFICTEEMRNNGARICDGEELLHFSEDADRGTLENMCQLLEKKPPIIFLMLSLRTNA